MGRWAEASRTPTAGDLHWGVGCQGHAARLSCGAPRSSASIQRARSWACSGVDQGLTSRATTSEGHDLQENMASRDITSKASLAGATGTDHILHFDKMILCLQSVTFFCPHSFLKVGPDLGQNCAAALSPESDSSLSSQEVLCSLWQ